MRATDAELADVLRLDGEATPGPWIAVGPWDNDVGVFPPDGWQRATLADRTFMRVARTLFPRVARELMALREQHRAADDVLTRCGFPPRGASDTLAERVARLVEAETTGGGEP